MTFAELMGEVSRRMATTEWENTSTQGGKIRWQNTISWASVDAVKAEWLTKEDGIWAITDEGKVALDMPLREFIRVADERYRSWRDARNSIRLGAAPKSPNGQDLDELRSILESAAGGFWWVNQGVTYQVELQGGYLWAPQKSKAGFPIGHHTNLLKVEPGDVILHYANSALRAISRVNSEAITADRPGELPGEPWDKEGYLLRTEYSQFTEPIALGFLPASIRTPDAGPFTQQGSVKQGYLFRLSAGFVDKLRDLARQPSVIPTPSHLLLKWSEEPAVDTIERHRAIANDKGSVWWGALGGRERRALSAQGLNRLQIQLGSHVPTFAFLYNPKSMWEAKVEAITDQSEAVDVEEMPDYYTTDECKLFVRLSNFRPLDVGWALQNLALASRPGEPIDQGALNNQTTPLLVQVLANPDTGDRPNPEFTFEDLAAATLWPTDQLRELVEALRGDSYQVVLAGPPGTSKTWVAKAIVRFLSQDRPGASETIQFHPSYSYEQFIEGLRPTLVDGVISFKPVDGILMNMVRRIDPNAGDYFLIIDEMNRANLPRVFGELMYLFEYRNERLNLPYTRNFRLPANLRFVGTMNTADRSIRSIDAALRRRFDVFEVGPDGQILDRFYESHTNEVPDLRKGFEALNSKLEAELGDRHHTVGHAFFMTAVMTPKRLCAIWKRKVHPLIQEYFFDQPDKVDGFKAETFWPSIACDP